jgi:hypothetical protein
MTNVIILGEQPEKKELKPIQFLYFLDFDKSMKNLVLSPKSYRHIELICREYTNEKYDLMFAYVDTRNIGVLYLGHFNDGIV